MRKTLPMMLIVAVALVAGCDRGSVGTKEISRCVPQGQCDPSMLTRGLVAEAGDAKRGATLFQTHCATCHGPDGRGGLQTPGLDLTTAVWQSRYRDGQIASIIRGGRPPKMPPFTLADSALRDLVAFVRSIKQESKAPARKQGY